MSSVNGQNSFKHNIVPSQTIRTCYFGAQPVTLPPPLNRLKSRSRCRLEWVVMVPEILDVVGLWR